MVKLHLMVRCSQSFTAIASVKVEPAAAIAVLLSAAARLLAQVALPHFH
jgi:hypothetical protein